MSFAARDPLAHLSPEDVPALKMCHAALTARRAEAESAGQLRRVWVLNEERGRLAGLREQIRRRFGK